MNGLHNMKPGFRKIVRTARLEHEARAAESAGSAPAAIVGIRADGIVRAVFIIDSANDEREAGVLAGEWRDDGRTIKRCSATHAQVVLGKPWIDEPSKG